MHIQGCLLGNVQVLEIKCQPKSHSCYSWLFFCFCRERLQFFLFHFRVAIRVSLGIRDSNRKPFQWTLPFSDHLSSIWRNAE